MFSKLRKSARGDVTGHKGHRSRLAVLLVTVLALAGLLGITPAPPAEAQQQEPPILVIGGFSMSEGAVQDFVTNLNDAGYQAYGTALSGFIPGSDEMATQGQVVQAHVEEVRAATGAAEVELFAISQGALAARHYLKHLGGTSAVSGLISFSGVNMGIPSEDDSWPLVFNLLIGYCVDNPGAVPVCDEIVYRQAPGDTAYLQQLSNDPTPAGVDYYHIWTEDWDVEGELPPGHAYTVWTPQQICGAGYSVGHADYSNAAMLALADAAYRRNPPPACPG